MDQAKPKVPTLWTLLVVLTAALLGGALYAVFYMAPVEARMGIVQKIFYFHVSSAFAMYVGFVAAALGSAVYLTKRKPAWDALAIAGAEVGMVFCLVVLTTGPLWARKAWGVWWTWDARLTTTMLAGMLYASFIAVRSGTGGEIEKRFASALALLGLPVIAVAHYAVKLWRGQHPTVISSEGGGLADSMKPAFFLSVVAFLALAALLIWTRMWIEQGRQRLLEVEIEAIERDLLEDV